MSRSYGLSVVVVLVDCEVVTVVDVDWLVDCDCVVVRLVETEVVVIEVEVLELVEVLVVATAPVMPKL